MKVTSRSFTITGALAMSAIVLAGCTAPAGEPGEGSEEPQFEGSLTVWVDADRAGVLEDVAAAFEDERGVHAPQVEKAHSCPSDCGLCNQHISTSITDCP